MESACPKKAQYRADPGPVNSLETEGEKLTAGVTQHFVRVDLFSS